MLGAGHGARPGEHFESAHRRAHRPREPAAMMRRRRPIMRGAMVGGVGYMAGKSAARGAAREQGQEQRLEGLESQQAAAPAPPVAAPAAPAGGLNPATIEQLKQLAELRDSGVLTSDEFDAQKKKLLGE